MFLMSMTLGAEPFQNDDNSVFSSATQQELKAIRAAAQSSDYFYEQVRFLCNAVGPRLSGSPQAAAAVKYVANQLRDVGFEVRLEPVNVKHWVRGGEEAQLTRYPGRVEQSSQKIVLTALGNSISTPAEGITAPILVVKTFDQLEQARAEQVKGKVVLFDHAFDEFLADAGRADEAYGSAVAYRSEGPASASRKGAIAALVRSVTPRDFPPEPSYNVIADLKGSQFTNQVVIVSAHLDSWDLGTGALDDASGVGLAMDVLRIIKAVNPRPKRTIRFVAWMDEENGGEGGHAYAENHRTELPNHIAAVELDYGDGRPLGLSIHATNDRFSILAPVLHTIADPLGGVVRVDKSPGADLRFICEAGVPVIAPLQDARHYFHYHHSAADTFEKVRPEELRRTLEATASLIYSLAQYEKNDH